MHRRERRPRLGRAGPRGVVVGSRHGGQGVARRGCRGRRGHRGGRPRTDARRRWTRRARRPVVRSRGSTHARRRRRPSWTTATGVRGWALGGLPAALWVERHEPAVAAATQLVSRHVGVARLPTDRCGGRRRSSRISSSRTRPLVAAAGVPAERLPARSATGAIVGDLTSGRGVRPRPATRASRSIGGTVDAFASYHGAGLLEPGDAYDPGGSAGGFGVYWDRPVEVPGGVRDAGATGRSVQRRRGHGGHRPGARLVPRRRPRWRRSRPRRCSPRPRRPRPAPTASSSCRTSRASGRRSGIRRRAACSPA